MTWVMMTCWSDGWEMVDARGVMRGGDYFHSEIDLGNSATTDALLEANGVKLQISVKVKWEPSRNRDICQCLHG
jgi:hypothetical protein